MSRRMSPAIVVLAHCLNFHEIDTRQMIYQTRFTYARRTQQRNRVAVLEILHDVLHSVSSDNADRVNSHPGSNGSHLIDRISYPIAQIRLAQNDDRNCAAFPRDQKVSLDPPQTEVLIQRR